MTDIYAVCHRPHKSWTRACRLAKTDMIDGCIPFFILLIFSEVPFTQRVQSLPRTVEPFSLLLAMRNGKCLVPPNQTGVHIPGI
jgi:hypothetical protein